LESGFAFVNVMTHLTTSFTWTWQAGSGSKASDVYMKDAQLEFLLATIL
jgi:hypothetical protein